MSIIELKQAGYRDGSKTILSGIDLAVEKGDFISVVGPSGGGKSTLLKMIADLLSPTEGDLFYEGKNYGDYPPTALRQNITLAFQTPYLFGDTVRENMNFPYEIHGDTPDEEKMKELLEEFEMSGDYLDKDVNKLSGGEAQRIALIRSLLYEPEVLLLDEVTSALDPENKRIVENVITRRNEDGMTILWITHDIKQSEDLADKRIDLEAGRIVKKEVL